MPLNQILIGIGAKLDMGSHRHKPLYTHYPVSVSVSGYLYISYNSLTSLFKQKASGCWLFFVIFETVGVAIFVRSKIKIIIHDLFVYNYRCSMINERDLGVLSQIK